MYTDDQYARAKAQVDGAPPEIQAKLRARIGEYEASKKPTAGLPASWDLPKPAPGYGTPSSDEQPKGPAVPELPAESGDVAPAGTRLGGHDLGALQLDTTRDFSLPNASKLKELNHPPEYAPPGGASPVSWFEPSVQKFDEQMGPVLRARHIVPNSPEYKDAYDEYRDRQWANALEQAKVTGTPLQRHEMVAKDRHGWAKLKTYLEEAPDVAEAFVNGLANSGSFGALQAADAAIDATGGGDNVGAFREQQARNPGAAMAGQVVGSITGGAAKLGSAIYGSTAGKLGAGLLGRTAAAAAAGVGSAEAQTAGETLGEFAGDAAHGGLPEDAKGEFLSRMLKTAAVAAPLSVAGHLGAEALDSGSKAFRSGELRQDLMAAERGGVRTDAVFGVKPTPEIQANIEQARPPLPGESKPLFQGTPTELQAEKLRAPLADKNAELNDAAHARMRAETEAQLLKNPKLKEPVPIRETANAALDEALSAVQPELRDTPFLPGQNPIMGGKGLAGGNPHPAIEQVKALWEPKLSLVHEAGQDAARDGGRVLTLGEARAVGIDVDALSHKPGADGVPPTAPAIPDEPAPSVVPPVTPRTPRTPPIRPAPEPMSDFHDPAYDAARNKYIFGEEPDPFPRDEHVATPNEDVTRKSNSPPVKLMGRHQEIEPPEFARGAPHDPEAIPEANPAEILPKYPRETLEAHRAQLAENPPTPEQAAALKRYSFGNDEAVRGVQNGTADTELAASRASRYGGEVDKTGQLHGDHVAQAKADAQQIEAYLRDTPPAANIPHVYRGIVMPEGAASDFLNRDVIDMGKAVSSVSADPVVARSFVARNSEPGTTGFTLKLKHMSARGIENSAAPGVRVEKELLLPGGTRFKVTGRYRDASNPGNYIIEAEEIPEATEDFLGRPLSKPEAEPPEPVPDLPGGARLRPRLRKAEPLTMPPARGAGPAIGGIPESEYRVIVTPRKLNATDLDRAIGHYDKLANARAEGAAPDPMWEKLQAAARKDRAQFGPEWERLKAQHHEELTGLEKRSGFAGLRNAKPDAEMHSNSLEGFSGRLTNYGYNPVATDEALRSIAQEAGLSKELETLGAQTAYAKLKRLAVPHMSGTMNAENPTPRLAGLGTAAKLRMDAVSRQLSRGPSGEALHLSPRLRAFVKMNAQGDRTLPGGLFGLGGGALGMKSAAGYNATQGRASSDPLTPAELEYLDKLIQATQGAAQ